jgi:hypothetical protein
MPGAVMTDLEQYLSKDPSLRDPLPSPELIPLTKKGRRSRPINMHSKGSVRGFTHFNGYPTWYESEGEELIGLSFLANPNVVDVIDQPPPVFYYDDDGVLRKHTFDWKVVEICATRTLVAVKRSEQVEKSGVQRVVDLVAEQLSPDIADYVVLATEAKLTRTDTYNAKLLYSATRETIPRDDTIVEHLIRKMRGHTTIGELVEASGIHGSGFRAIVRAIANRRLVLTTYRTIDHDAVVKRGRTLKR